MGGRDPEALSELEGYRFGVLTRQQWLTLQNVYFQHELAVLDPRVWRGYRLIICDSWVNPGVRATWPNSRRLLDPGFVALVEGCPSPDEAP